jgi:beta-lactamase regulating signal transducer with metallopeptidase domain
MTGFGLELGWLAARVTVVALAALGLMGWCGRRGARSAVVVLAGAMVIFLTLPAAALCPWPDGWRWSSLTNTPAATPALDANDLSGQRVPSSELPMAEPSLLAKLTSRLSDWGSQVSEELGWQCAWSLAGGLYVLGVALGCTRLLLGWRALGKLRRRSRPIVDAELLELAEAVRTALQCSRTVELRQADEPGLAATLGWRRPLILLPPEWRLWSPDERRAVLAHELAHVEHGDFLLGLLSSLCRALHFYHPLVRWLAAQMRWHQEVAADDVAAMAAGGRPNYLKALARLALRSPVRTPARAFILPAMTGGIVLRRIHMLRGTEKRPMTRMTRGLFIALLAGTALLVSAWRGPAESPNAAVPPSPAEPFDLGYIGPEAKAVVALRPSVWLQQPGMDKVSFDEFVQELKKEGIHFPDALRPQNIEQVVGNLHLMSEGTGKPGSRGLSMGTSSLLIRFHKEVDGLGLLRPFVQEMKEVRVRKGDVIIHHLGTIPELGPLPVAMFMPDRRTVVFVADKKENAAEALIDQVAAARARDWGSGWKQVERAPFAVVFDNTDGGHGKRHAKDLDDLPYALAVLDRVRFVTLGIELGDGRPVRLVLDAKSPAVAEVVEETANRFLQQAMTKLKQEIDPTDPGDKLWLKLFTELVDSRQARVQGSRLEWLGYSSIRVRDFIGAWAGP